mmetsp:Transcript_927/g.2902  ORF Transcript_927/g.2902 Transcript_927/m.2902 type:complete len:211 (+) Transcript_927:228-860(+)
MLPHVEVRPRRDAVVHRRVEGREDARGREDGLQGEVLLVPFPEVCLRLLDSEPLQRFVFHVAVGLEEGKGLLLLALAVRSRRPDRRSGLVRPRDLAPRNELGDEGGHEGLQRDLVDPEPRASCLQADGAAGSPQDAAHDRPDPRDVRRGVHQPRPDLALDDAAHLALHRPRHQVRAQVVGLGHLPNGDVAPLLQGLVDLHPRVVEVPLRQ